MKKILLLITFLTCSYMGAWGDNISPEEAKALAENFFLSTHRKAPGNHTKATPLRLVKQADHYYLFNRGTHEGYAVVAADDACENSILGYAYEGTLDADNLPPAMTWWLEGCARQIEAAKHASKPQEANPLMAADNEELPYVEPLMSNVLWEQGDPYNIMCPHVSEISGPSLVGCVALAAGQIMYYHKWPQQGVGYHEYEWAHNDFGDTKTLSANFAEHTYNFNNMQDSYARGYSTQEEIDDVAFLLYDIGIAFDMRFHKEESGTYLTNALRGLKEHFSYDEDAYIAKRDFYNNEEWERLIHNELSQQRPVLYDGKSMEGGGHAFVIHGYSDHYFRINWGWGGIGNGWFVFGADMIYCMDQGAIIGLKPDDGISTPPTDDRSAGDIISTAMMSVLKWDSVLRQDVAAEKFSFDDYASIGNVFHNNTLQTFNEFYLGLKVEDAAGNVTYLSTDNCGPMKPHTYFASFYVFLASFPRTEGTYSVTPAYRIDGGEWHEVVRPKVNSNSFTATVKGDTITLKETTDFDLEITLSDDYVLAESAQQVHVNVKNNGTGEYHGLLSIIITTDYNGGQEYCHTRNQLVTIAPGSTYVFESYFWVNEPNGNFIVTIIDQETERVLATKAVPIQKEKQGTIEFSDFKLAGNRITNPSELRPSVTVTCTSGEFDGHVGTVYCVEYYDEDYEREGYFDENTGYWMYYQKLYVKPLESCLLEKINLVEGQSVTLDLSNTYDPERIWYGDNINGYRLLPAYTTRSISITSDEYNMNCIYDIDSPLALRFQFSDPSGINAITSSADDEVSRHTITGTKASPSYKGMVIVKYRDGRTKKVMAR